MTKYSRNVALAADPGKPQNRLHETNDKEILPRVYRAKHNKIVAHAAELPDYEARIEAACAEALANGVDPELVRQYRAKLIRDIELSKRV